MSFLLPELERQTEIMICISDKKLIWGHLKKVKINIIV